MDGLKFHQAGLVAIIWLRYKIMALKTKRAIVSLISLSLLVNLILGIYLVQVKTNCKAKIKMYSDEIQDLSGDVDYYKDQYKRYLELSEELQNQLGVYCDR